MQPPAGRSRKRQIACLLQATSLLSISCERLDCDRHAKLSLLPPAHFTGHSLPIFSLPLVDHVLLPGSTSSAHATGVSPAGPGLHPAGGPPLPPSLRPAGRQRRFSGEPLAGGRAPMLQRGLQQPGSVQCSSDALLTMCCLPCALTYPPICCLAHAQVSLEFCSYPPSYRHPKVPEGLQYYTLQAQLSGETGALPLLRC